MMLRLVFNMAEMRHCGSAKNAGVKMQECMENAVWKAVKTENSKILGVSAKTKRFLMVFEQ